MSARSYRDRLLVLAHNGWLYAHEKDAARYTVRNGSEDECCEDYLTLHTKVRERIARWER